MAFRHRGLVASWENCEFRKHLTRKYGAKNFEGTLKSRGRLVFRAVASESGLPLAWA